MDSELWQDKYAPKSLNECAGNDDARDEIRKWALEWTRQQGKPLLIAGPAGCGKTTIARAVAAENDWEIVEATPSDARDKESLKKLFGQSSGLTLFGKRRMFLIEDVDSAFDRGEVPELARILADAHVPVILTAYNPWEPKISAVRVACKNIQLKAINATTMKRVLSSIAVKEKLVGNTALEIAAESDGDLRSALIDLQSGALSDRERKKDVFRIVSRILKTTDFWEAIHAGDESDADFDMLQRWIEQNIPVEYEAPEEIAAAYDALSRADIFSARIMRRQKWSLQKYARVLTLAGVAMAKNAKYPKFSKYEFPSYIRLLSASRQSRALNNRVLGKARQALHCSRMEAATTMRILGQGSAIAAFAELDEDEAEFAGKAYKAPASSVARK